MKKTISARINAKLWQFIDDLVFTTPYNKSDIVELALYDFMKKYKKKWAKKLKTKE